MAIYEFVCESCDITEDRFLLMSKMDVPQRCKECGQIMRRQLTIAAVQTESRTKVRRESASESPSFTGTSAGLSLTDCSMHNCGTGFKGAFGSINIDGLQATNADTLFDVHNTKVTAKRLTGKNVGTIVRSAKRKKYSDN